MFHVVTLRSQFIDTNTFISSHDVFFFFFLCISHYHAQDNAYSPKVILINPKVKTDECMPYVRSGSGILNDFGRLLVFWTDLHYII